MDERGTQVQSEGSRGFVTRFSYTNFAEGVEGQL